MNFLTFMIGSGRKKILSKAKIFCFSSCFNRSFEGHVILNIFFENLFHNSLLKKVSGKPEILSTNLVLVFKRLNIKIGSDVNK